MLATSYTLLVLRTAAIIMIFSGILYLTCLALSRLAESKNKNYLIWDSIAKIFSTMAAIFAVVVVVATVIYLV
jgi:hypothetical protein